MNNSNKNIVSQASNGVSTVSTAHDPEATSPKASLPSKAPELIIQHSRDSGQTEERSEQLGKPFTVSPNMASHSQRAGDEDYEMADVIDSIDEHEIRTASNERIIDEPGASHSDVALADSSVQHQRDSYSWYHDPSDSLDYNYDESWASADVTTLDEVLGLTF